MAEESSNQSTPTLVYYSLSGHDAMAVLRVIGPGSFAGMKIVYGYDKNEINAEAVKQGDIVVLQRDICRYHDKYEQIMTLAHAENKPVVFDLDDLLFELPANHPDRTSGFYAEALLPMLQAVIEADLVTVATEPIKDYLLPFNRNVEVIPNYLNDSLWNVKSFEKPIREKDSITIGYMGGHSHRPDLLMVLPALKIINEKYPDRIRYHFWGIEPSNELIEISQTDWCPPQSYTYEEFVNYFQTQTADIVIAPLCNNLFNSCKSPIKYLEYSANGLPGVYSNLRPYSDVIENGEDGFLATSIDDWVEMLSSLIENQDLRHKFVANSQSKIFQQWLLSKNHHKQKNIYQKLLDRNRTYQKEYLPLLNVFRNLSVQYHENFNRNKFLNESLMSTIEECKQRLQELSSQLEEQQKAFQSLIDQNVELQEEIMSYVMSKSWRYTRPLRAIIRRVRKVMK